MLEEVIKQLGDDAPELIGLDVNDWGSCQYAGALNFFNVMKAMESKFGREQALEKMGIKVEFLGIRTIEELIGVELFINKLENYEQLFEVTRDQSWDLWSAAPSIAEIVFVDLKIGGVEEAPGVGPVLNVLAQSENYETGLYCWLLVSYGLIEDESAFGGFDT